MSGISLPALVPVATLAVSPEDMMGFWRRKEQPEQAAPLVTGVSQGAKQYDMAKLRVALAWSSVVEGLWELSNETAHGLAPPTLDDFWRQIWGKVPWMTLAQAAGTTVHDTEVHLRWLKSLRLVYPDGTLHSEVRAVANRLIGGFA